MRRYALRDDQWEKTEPLLPGKVSDVGVTARDNRLFVEAVLYRYRAASRGVIFPSGSGVSGSSTHAICAGRRKGVWERIFNALAQDNDNEYAMIDSTIVRTHQHSAGGKGRQKN